MYHFPEYHKHTDYITNAKSYYDYLGRVNEFLKLMGIRIEEYDGILDAKLKEINDRLTNLDPLVKAMIEKWLIDGTIEDLIDELLFKKLNNEISQLKKEVFNLGITKIYRRS